MIDTAAVRFNDNVRGAAVPSQPMPTTPRPHTTISGAVSAIIPGHIIRETDPKHLQINVYGWQKNYDEVMQIEQI